MSNMLNFNCCRATGPCGARTGHEDASDSKQKVLLGCQAEPERSFHQSSRGMHFIKIIVQFHLFGIIKFLKVEFID